MKSERKGLMTMAADQRRTTWADLVVIQEGPSRFRIAGLMVAGGCAGAAVAYLLDPQRGHTRRAHLRDQASHATHELQDGLGVLARDAGNRGRGVVAGVRYRIRGGSADDRVLHERVRAELGRHVTHAHAVEISVADGVVTLAGEVLAGEAEHAQRGIRHIPGVRRVEPSWSVHRDAADVPRLQGGRPRRPTPELLQERWAPTTRLLAGAGAVTILSMARRLPGPIRWMARCAGGALAVRAATNLPMKRITGITAGRRAVDLDDAISIGAPIEQIWPLVSDYTVFAKLMPDVREIRRSADGRLSHWTIAGPAGVPVRFDAVETKRQENREIAWKTTEGQLVAHTGAIRLMPEPGGRTRVQVRLTYNPVAGAVGHAIAAMLGANPAHRMKQDLMRLKSYAEARATQPVRT